MADYNTLLDLAALTGCEVRHNIYLSEYTSFRTGGLAPLLIIPTSRDALASVLGWCKGNGTRHLLLGLGSNVLAPDSGFDGVVIRTADGLGGITSDGEYIRCSAGVRLSRLCLYALEHSLTGLEFAYGIPGTAGGGAYMNCGAYGGEMKDVLVSCEHLTPDLTTGRLEGEALALGYRTSAYASNGCIITELTLKLEHGEQSEIKAKMDDYTHRRRDKQPLEYPSAGSTFKRPEGYFAGALIEECGLKGCRVGAAEVSTKHAGFIINTGGATSTDILELINHVKNTVFEQKGVMLETEIRILEG